jgi:transcriptional regulator with XRE-family HTH domain
MQVIVINPAGKKTKDKPPKYFKTPTRKKTMMDIYVRIGENIRNLRENADMSLKELAHDARIAPSFLSNIENAARRPSMYVLERIAKALGEDLRNVIGLEAMVNPVSLAKYLELTISGAVKDKNIEQKKKILKFIRKI